MPIQPLKDINEYVRVKESLRNRFDAERTGDQDLFTEQAKLLKPLINTQEQAVRAIQDNKDIGLNVLSKELQRRNDQFDLLSEQPFYQYDIVPAIQGSVQASTPANKSTHIEINLDSGLSEIDKNNLRTMRLKLPSEVFKDKTFEETLEKIKTENRTIGQYLGKKSTASVTDKEGYKSLKNTLDIYREKILGLEGAQQFVGRGLKKTRKTAQSKQVSDVILYQNIGDLCSKLEQLNAAKRAGNTGVDNIIISILDELLKVQAISKREYDELYKNILYIK